MSTDIGSMCVILHRERSFHNVDIRILKSALQKYARRANMSKGIWCLIELDLFSYFEINPRLHSTEKLTTKQIQMNATRIRSNMINRLIAMMSEDVGPTNSHLPMRIHQFYLNWIQHRREPTGRNILVQIYHCLANENVKRIRLLSDLRTVFNLPEYLTENQSLHRQLLEKFQMNQLIEILYENQQEKLTVNAHIFLLSIEFVFFYRNKIFTRKLLNILQTNRILHLHIFRFYFDEMILKQ